MESDQLFVFGRSIIILFMSESLKQKTLKGTKWSAVEKLSVQVFQFLVMLVMARLLTPDDYGTVGLVAIFTAIAQSLVESGFSQALVRKQDRTDVDCNTVFYFNLVVSLALYGLCFIIAPFVAEFYEIPVLCPLMRVICLVFVVNGLAVVQRAIFTAVVDFRSQAIATLAAGLVSGVLGIGSAYLGYGVWALVIQQLSNALVLTVVLWMLSTWRPKLQYSRASFHELFGFGSKFMISGIINNVYNNISGMIIGKIYTPATLGYYSRAQHFSTVPSSTLSGVVSSVTYPVLCTIQDQNEKLQDVYRRLIKMSAYIVFPLMILMSAVAEPMVIILVGEKWRFSGELLTIIGFSMMWYPIHLLNLNLLAVKGRSDLFLRLEIIKKLIGLIVICVSIPFGIVVFAYCGILSSIISLVINTYYTGKLINVGFFTQMKDIFNTFIMSMTMFVLIRLTYLLIDNIYIQFVGGGIFGIIYILAYSKIFKFRELEEVVDIIKKKK